ncbi:MAG TPA: BrnA antitoxin family protein [Rhodopseudomonas sp.]|uniref:BrnA antitoxin family protein n=1 Tax=Rhodopseudomonas sp. TaxID=1078 RepID=UPI002ED7F7E6
MSKKPKFDPAIHDENPEWTAEDFAKARPASELPPEILAQFKNKVGRPRIESPKVPVKLRLDGAVVEALRATGPGWQTRINDMLKSKISRGKVRFDADGPVKRKRA